MLLAHRLRIVAAGSAVGFQGYPWSPIAGHTPHRLAPGRRGGDGQVVTAGHDAESLRGMRGSSAPPEQGMPKMKPRYQFNEIDRRRIDHAVGAFCQAHRLRSAEPYVRLYYRVQGRSVVLLEDRRHFRDETHWVTVPIARLCFDDEMRRWGLQWRRASGRWAPYPGWAPTAGLAQPLEEIVRDPERLFWG